MILHKHDQVITDNLEPYAKATNQAAGEMKIEVEKEPHLTQDAASRVVKKQPPSLSSKSVRFLNTFFA